MIASIAFHVFLVGACVGIGWKVISDELRAHDRGVGDGR